MQELSIVQSSLFVQAITNGGITGGAGGLGVVGTGGLGVGVSANGGGVGVDGPIPGTIG